MLRGRLSGAPGEPAWDSDVPAEQQVVTYKTQNGEIRTITKAELQHQLEQSEKLMASVTETWEEKLARTHEIQKEREQALEALGITIEKNLVGVHTPKKVRTMTCRQARMAHFPLIDAASRQFKRRPAYVGMSDL